MSVCPICHSKEKPLELANGDVLNIPGRSYKLTIKHGHVQEMCWECSTVIRGYSPKHIPIGTLALKVGDVVSKV